VFHATGSGGKAMKKLVDSQLLDCVLDITTTEVCDYLFDGYLPVMKIALMPACVPKHPVSSLVVH